MQPDLVALVGSRICHDLISPIGAIGNGVELLSLTTGNTDPEMALISDSVSNANARIRLFRIAFGAIGDGQRISSTEVQNILSGVANGGRNSFHWNISGDQPRALVKMALLLLLCFENALPLGGDMTVSSIGDTWHFTAKSKRVTIEPDLWNGMLNLKNAHRHTAAQVQFALLPLALAEAERTLSFRADETTLSAQF